MRAGASPAPRRALATARTRSLPADVRLRSASTPLAAWSSAGPCRIRYSFIRGFPLAGAERWRMCRVRSASVGRFAGRRLLQLIVDGTAVGVGRSRRRGAAPLDRMLGQYHRFNLVGDFGVLLEVGLCVLATLTDSIRTERKPS